MYVKRDSNLYIIALIGLVWFGLVWFYGISTIVGYSIPNPVLFQTIQFGISIVFVYTLL